GPGPQGVRAREPPLRAADRAAAFICLTVVAILQTLLQQNGRRNRCGPSSPRHASKRIRKPVRAAAHLGAGEARPRFGALIASATGKDKNARRRRPARKTTAKQTVRGCCRIRAWLRARPRAPSRPHSPRAPAAPSP